VVLRAYFVLLGFLFLSTITAQPARADPIRVTGDVLIDDIPIERTVDIRLQIGDLPFFIATGGDGEKRRIFFPAPPPERLEDGIPVDLSSRVTQSFPTTLPLHPPDIFFTANFVFTALPTVLASCSFGGACQASSRFSLTGMVTGVDAAGRSLFERQLVGTGEAGAGFQSFGGSQGGVDRGRLRTVFYRFDPVDPAPVPEPGTVVLFGIGAAVMGRRAWRRFSRCQ
jgi:hypothetical protein